MGFLVSPGVETKEIDLTNVIPAVSTSIGGYAGHFRWGPTETLITVSSEKEMASIFGTPNSTFSVSFLQAASFLKYTNTLLVSRAIDTDVAVNASTSADASPMSYIKDADNLPVDSAIYARYAGSMGNTLKVIIIDENVNVDYSPTAESDFLALFSEGTPDTGNISVMVIDEDGDLTGTADNVIEIWENLSTTAGAKKDDGSNNYFNDVINSQSSYIYAVGTYSSIIQSSSPPAGLYVESLDGGADGTVSAASIVTALDLFSDCETVDVNLLLAEAGGTLTTANEKTIADTMIAIVEARKDCVCFIGAPSGTDGVQLESSDANKWNNINDYFNVTGGGITSTSYAVFGSTPVYVYNKYLDSYNWISCAGHMAGLCANTDNVADPWFSPAGYNRGGLLGVTKVAFNPNQSYRDLLYKGRINPIVAFPGQGIILFGDKTAQSKASAFDRINVRRLFCVLEKAIATAAKYQLFELNDEFTRAMFRNMTEPFLRDVKGRRGITDFLVVCDETNNTGEVIDTNRFVADIYIKPARSINYITLNFIATRTGVEFSEIVGK